MYHWILRHPLLAALLVAASATLVDWRPSAPLVLEALLLAGLLLGLTARATEQHAARWVPGQGWDVPPAADPWEDASVVDRRVYCAWCTHPMETHTDDGCTAAHVVDGETISCGCLLTRGRLPGGR